MRCPEARRDAPEESAAPIPIGLRLYRKEILILLELSGCCLVLSVTIVVFNGRKTVTMHPVDVKCAMEMINLMLKYACMPS